MLWFAWLWALYAFLHQALTYWHWLQFSDPANLALGLATFVLAVPVLFKPGSMVWLAALAAVWAGYKFYLMPELPNHVFVTMLVNLTLLACIAHRLMRGGAAPASVYEIFAPLGRWFLLIVYFFAVLHKLNRDYFNPAVSCGWELYEQITHAVGLPLDFAWMRWPAVFGGVGMEALIPILLVIPRTRIFGIVLGLCFHVMLAIHENLYIASFTSMMLAMYSLFLPAWFFGVIAERWRASRMGAAWKGRWGRWSPAALFAGFAVFGAAVAIVAAATGRLSRDGLITTLHTMAPTTARVLWFLAVLMLVGLVLFVAYRHRRGGAAAPAAALLAPRATPALVLPVLLFINGFSPYVGLKTQTSLAMFSNLRTEEGLTNHLFLPSGPLLGTYQEDMVQILRANDPSLEPVAAVQEYLPFVELRRRVHRSEDPALEVEYVRNGEVHLATRSAGGDPVFVPPSWAERKFLSFRPVPAPVEPCPCRH